MEVLVTTGAISRAKLQSDHHHQQTNIQFLLQAGCPSCRPTNSVKALKGKISHSMDLITPSSPGGLPTLSLPTNSSWLPRGGLPYLSSALWCQYPILLLISCWKKSHFALFSAATVCRRGGHISPGWCIPNSIGQFFCRVNPKTERGPLWDTLYIKKQYTNMTCHKRQWLHCLVVHTSLQKATLRADGVT